MLAFRSCACPSPRLQGLRSYPHTSQDSKAPCWPLCRGAASPAAWSRHSIPGAPGECRLPPHTTHEHDRAAPLVCRVSPLLTQTRARARHHHNTWYQVVVLVRIVIVVRFHRNRGRPTASKLPPPPISPPHHPTPPHPDSHGRHQSHDDPGDPEAGGPGPGLEHGPGRLGFAYPPPGHQGE